MVQGCSTAVQYSFRSHCVPSTIPDHLPNVPLCRESTALPPCCDNLLSLSHTIMKIIAYHPARQQLSHHRESGIEHSSMSAYFQKKLRLFSSSLVGVFLRSFLAFRLKPKTCESSRIKPPSRSSSKILVLLPAHHP